jgi:hypothetical protein
MCASLPLLAVRVPSVTAVFSHTLVGIAGLNSPQLLRFSTDAAVREIDCVTSSKLVHITLESSLRSTWNTCDVLISHIAYF